MYRCVIHGKSHTRNHTEIVAVCKVKCTPQSHICEVLITFSFPERGVPSFEVIYLKNMAYKLNPYHKQRKGIQIWNSSMKDLLTVS